jgi:predicted O-methyltransferase YrrM
MLQVKKKLFLLHQYLIYRLRAKTTHGTHSPFVFDMLNKAIYSPHPFYAYKKIEAYRRQLLASEQQIRCRDFGTGATDEDNLKQVNAIAKRAVKPAKYGQLLFRLINYFQPKTILELGTSLGVTTCYLSAANSGSQVITMEGCPETAAIAKENWEQLGYKNISAKVGNFDELLPEALLSIPTLDFVFFDGNHRKQPTLDYFNKCLERSHDKSIFVMDDIYWSEEMKEAWEEIKADKRVTITIDLFFVGLVFFRKGQVKQNFVIKF